MKLLYIIICLFANLCMIANNPKTTYAQIKLDPYESKTIKLRKIDLRDSTIVSVLNSCIPEIKDICKLHQENHYIRMVFVNDTITHVVLYPESLRNQFTIDFWKTNKKNIIGYLYADNVLVIIQGKGAKHFVKKKGHTKELTIIHFPPSNASDWSYWRYKIENGIITKERHLTRTPYILY